MKRFLSFITLLIMAGCTQSYEDVATISASEEFYATIEGSDTDTRTYVDGNITTRWHADDRLTIFKKETYNREYKFKGRTGDNSGGFTQVSVDDDFYSSEQLDKNYAVYPHSNDNCFNKQTESFELIMPAEQTYAENTFGRGANTMVAVSDTGQLLFKNVGSFLRVRLWGENTAVSSITITSNGDEVISGEAIVKPTMGGDPTCVMTGSEKSIILNCPTPITISESESTPTDFWIVLPPVIFENGFTVTVKNTDDEVQTFNKNEKFTFGRNLYYNFKREVTLGTGVDQSAPSSNEIWYTTTDGEELTLNNNAWLNVNITSNIYKNGKGVISFDNDITSINMGAFYNCYSLKSITLPAGVVRIGSYAFYDCDSLESISIPDGVNEICANAFDSCNNLENFIIPASVTNIGSSAFKDCISLKSITIPNSVTRISSTTFYGCHNLENISIPESITEIGAAAFYSCTSLKSINIPENIVDIDKEAFRECTSLKNVYITNLEAWYNINFEEPLSNPMCAGANLYLNNTQLNKYLEDLAPNSNLVYLVKSDKCSQELKKVPYFTWTELDSMLDTYLNDFEIGDVEEYLIDQFRMMLENLGLVDKYKDRVIVVAGTFGAKIAAEYHFYACQNHRSFKNAKYIAFYSNKEISSMYEIEDNYPKNDVYLRNENTPEQFFKEYGKWYRETDKVVVFKLKGKNLISGKVIRHNMKNSNNRVGAYTQKHRYVSFKSIMNAKTTAELENWN